MNCAVQPGDVVNGKYMVEQLIGRGGVGYVVAARHLVLERPVALKFLLPALQGEVDVCQRFVREGRAVARMRSPHVVRVLDAEPSPQGPYLVMEYLEGEDLSALVRRRGSLEIAEAVELLLQACEAVDEAHSLRILHRDLKPSNLFLAKGAEGGAIVKVLDFGLSKSLSEGVDAGALTESNRVLGSPHYMAPEQIRTPKDVDERADVWALGATLFNLLTGHVPFDGASMVEVCGALLCGPPPAIARFRSDVPPELEACVLRCLKVDRSERWPSVRELARQLAPFAPLAAQGTVARSNALASTLPSGLPRSRRALAWVGLVALLGLVAMEVAGRRWIEANRTTAPPAAAQTVVPLPPNETAPPIGASAAVVPLGSAAVVTSPKSPLSARRPVVPPAGTPRRQTASEVPSSCAEPFYIDVRGLKAIRPECL